MFGSFTWDALHRYAELVRHREKQVRGGQGTEAHDNYGVGKTDHSFIDTDGSQDAEDYAERCDTWDYTTCLRPNGTLYGIGKGKCRKGTEVSAEEVRKRKEAAKTPKQKRREELRKKGERHLIRERAKEVLSDLQREGRKEKATAEQRRKDSHADRARMERLQTVVGKATRTLDRLTGRRKRMKEGSEGAKQLDARIARLQGVIGRLQKAKSRLRDKEEAAMRAADARKPKSALPDWPAWATTGKQLR